MPASCHGVDANGIMSLSAAGQSIARYFSNDYFSARERFIACAKQQGAHVRAHPISVRGPADEPLAIDSAYLGDPAPVRLLIITAGIHGAEGFAGSALQLRLLEALPSIAAPERCGVLLVHALNPYGFAYERRVNEHNVDLNRNGLASFPGPANPAYAAFESLLNPRTPVPRSELFLPRLLGLGLKHGWYASAQAIAGGQYTYPRSLFYGGAHTEESVAIFGRMLCEDLYQQLETALHVDLHTGLGAYGACTLYSEAAAGAATCAKLRDWFDGRVMTADERGRNSTYAASGVIGTVSTRMLHAARVYAVTLELGTYPRLPMLRVLRAENRLYHYGATDASRARLIKAQFREAFCPQAARWRRSALENGSKVLQQAVRALFDLRA